MELRTLADVITRSQLWNVASKLFGGKRDLYQVLGYPREITVQEYRSTYRRNGVANRIVKAFPKATWRGGMDLVEDEDPTVETAFEAAWHDLNKRLHIEETFYRADKLAGIGRYAIIWIGAPGETNEPLESCTADEIYYLTPYAEDDAKIVRWDDDIRSPRFGRPVFYQVQRSRMNNARTGQSAAQSAAKMVHWTRCIHIADDPDDDMIFAPPRLEKVFNYLIDLEKVSGGGSEAFWRRADQGRHFDLDPNVKMSDEDQKKMAKKIEAYLHGMERDILTRGVTVESLGSDVADFSRPVASLIDLISATTGIPQRILMGSERGQLASNQDRSNWDDQVQDRRLIYAEPIVVRQTVDRFIELGAMPAPAAGDYDVEFSALRVMDDGQRAEVASKWASLNQQAGETVVVPNEIRERVLDLPPLNDVLNEEPGGGGTSDPNAPPEDPNAPPKAASTKGGAGYEHVHRAADRFRGPRPTYRQLLLRRGSAERQPVPASERSDA